MRKIDLEGMIQYEEDKITSPKKPVTTIEPVFTQELLEKLVKNFTMYSQVMYPDAEPPVPQGLNRSERREWEKDQALRLKLAGIKKRANT